MRFPCVLLSVVIDNGLVLIPLRVCGCYPAIDSTGVAHAMCVAYTDTNYYLCRIVLVVLACPNSQFDHKSPDTTEPEFKRDSLQIAKPDLTKIALIEKEHGKG